MARVSLIVLRAPGISWPSERVAGCRALLEEQGHDVEVLAVADPRALPSMGPDEPWCRQIIAGWPGLTEAAVAGLRAAAGDHLVLLDLGMAYAPDDVRAVVGCLDSGESDLVVAARPGRLIGPIATRLIGTADPSSGLVGLTRASAREADGSFSPVGARFALEMLTRVPGRWVDVPVAGPVAAGPRTSPRFDDIRMAKRLADDRFGNASRLLQFCFVGASGMVVDLSCYAALQMVLGATPLAGMKAPLVGGSLALASAAVLAVATALTWNFSINRRLTFNDARGRSSIARQYVRYLLSNLLGIAVSLTLRLGLPRSVGFFERHHLAAAVVGIVAATGISFTMARWFVFGRGPAASKQPASPTARRRCAGLRPHARRHLTRAESQAVAQADS